MRRNRFARAWLIVLAAFFGAFVGFGRDLCVRRVPGAAERGIRGEPRLDVDDFPTLTVLPCSDYRRPGGPLRAALLLNM